MKINFALARSPGTVVYVQPSITDEDFLQPNTSLFSNWSSVYGVIFFKKKKKKQKTLFQESDFPF